MPKKQTNIQVTTIWMVYMLSVQVIATWTESMYTILSFLLLNET